MTRIIPCLFFSLFAAQAFAQDPASNPVGALIVPTSDIIMFDLPPSGAFQSVPIARGIVQPGNAGNTWFALQPDGTAPSGYSVTGETAPLPAQLTVSQFVDVYQDKALNRWVLIAPLNDSAPGGWALWGEAGQLPQGFTILPNGGN